MALLRSHPSLPAALHLLAALSSIQGDFLKADQLLSRAVRCQPLNFSWRQQLATIRIAAGNFSAALKILRSRQVPDDDPVTLRLRAIALRNSGQIELALQTFEHWLAIQPESAEACLGVGRCLLILQRIDEAEALCLRSAQLDPISSHDLHAEIHHARCNYGQSLAHRRELLALKPDDPEKLVAMPSPSSTSAIQIPPFLPSAALSPVP